MICDIVGFRGEVHYDLNKPDGTPRKLLASDKLRELGWEPKTSLRDGLEQTYAWFMQNHSSKRTGGTRGTDPVTTAHQSMLSSIEEFDSVVDQLREASGLIGHNDPTGQLKLFGDEIDSGSVIQNVDVLRRESAIPRMMEKYLNEIATQIRNAAVSIRKELGPDGDIFAKEAAKAAGAEAGKRVGRVILIAMAAEALMAIYHAAKAWMKAVFTKG